MHHSVTPALEACARRLLAHQAASGKPARERELAAIRVCEDLRGPLGKLMGLGGFRALLSRALVLAGERESWLRTLQVMANGSLMGPEKLEVEQDARVLARGEIVLMSQLLGLLVTFVGATLTLRLLRDIWPEITDLDL